MACMAYRIFESNTLEKRMQMRSNLLLQFCAILFNKRFYTLEEMLANVGSLSIDMSKYPYRHPAIQFWCQKTYARTKEERNPIPHDPRTFFETDLARVKQEAIRFLNKNKDSGHCTCRYTMSALFADYHRYRVYIYEGEKCDSPIVIDPPEYNTDNMMLGNNRKKRTNKEYFVYIWYDQSAFHLLLPLRKNGVL